MTLLYSQCSFLGAILSNLFTLKIDILQFNVIFKKTLFVRTVDCNRFKNQQSKAIIFLGWFCSTVFFHYVGRHLHGIFRFFHL